MEKMPESSVQQPNDSYKCKNCRAPLESIDFKFCPRCGAKDPIEFDDRSKSHCEKCGNELREKDIFCPICGTKTKAEMIKTEAVRSILPEKEQIRDAVTSAQPNPPENSNPPPPQGIDPFVKTFSFHSGLELSGPNQFESSVKEIEIKKGTNYYVDKNKIAFVCPHDSVIRRFALDDIPVKNLKMMDRKGHTYVGLNSSFIDQKYLEAFLNTYRDISSSTDISYVHAVVRKDSKYYIGLISDTIDCFISPSFIPDEENKSAMNSVNTFPPPSNDKIPSLCPKCGNKLKGEEKFCGKCGTKISHENQRIKKATERAEPPTLIAKQNKNKEMVVKPQSWLDRKLHGTLEEQAEKRRLDKYYEKVLSYSGDYYGGHPGFAVRDKVFVGIDLDDNINCLIISTAGLQIEMDLSIPYANIIGIQNQKQEHRTTVGGFAPVGFGYFGMSGEGKSTYTLYSIITYREKNGAVYSLTFVFSDPESTQSAIFMRIPH